MTIYYIDPGVASGGDGSIGSPFNSWASVTWTAGNSYYQKAGTSIAETITPSSSGTAAARITIGRYGTGANPIVGVGQQRGVFLSARQFIDIIGIDATGATDHGFHIRTNGSNIQSIRLYDCNSYNNQNNGFFLDGQVLTATLTNVLFVRCNSYNNLEHGFDTLGIIKYVTWIDCKAWGNGTGVLGHGFSLHPFASTSITSGWTLAVGNVYTRTLSASEDVQKVINRTSGVILTKNAGATTSVGSNEWDQSGTTLYINIGGTDPNTVTMAWKRASHGPFFYYGCESYNNQTDAGSGEGHGFAADDMSGPAFYYGCFSHDNEGAGFQNQWSVDVTIQGCIAYKNKLSNFRTTGYTQNLIVDNNTSVESEQHGMFFDDPKSGTLVRNNMIVGNGTKRSDIYGLIATSSSGITASYNNVYNNGSTGTNSTNNVTNSNGFTQNPNFISVYIPTNSSLMGVGLYLDRSSFGLSKFKNPPSIGAIEIHTTSRAINTFNPELG